MSTQRDKVRELAGLLGFIADSDDFQNGAHCDRAAVLVREIAGGVDLPTLRLILAAGQPGEAERIERLTKEHEAAQAEIDRRREEVLRRYDEQTARIDARP